MVKFLSNIFLGLVLLVASARLAWSQGFENLDFESANVSGYPVGSVIPATSAFPGWSLSVVAGNILYDNLSLSGESISLIDTNTSANWQPNYQPIQGNYFVLLASGNYPGTGVPISIGQTGQIPESSQSVSFWGDIGGLQVTFNGNPLNFFVTGSTANYNIYSADISAYAGQSGQLLFTDPPYTGGAMIDNIQFSTAAVPEPSSFALSVLGGLLFSFRCRKTLSARALMDGQF